MAVHTVITRCCAGLWYCMRTSTPTPANSVRERKQAHRTCLADSARLSKPHPKQARRATVIESRPRRFGEEKVH